MKHDNLKGLVGESWIWPLGKAFDHFKSVIVPFLEEENLKTATYKEVETTKQIFPATHNIFRAFKEVPFDCVRVVIIGQDPYHDVGSATGLAFDNPKTQKPSPSLRNILTEIEADTGTPSLAFTNVGSYLEHLPSQGVMLLNAALTVAREMPGSHSGIWKPFMQEVIFQMNARLSNVVWVLWGNNAKKYKKLITNPSHRIIEGAHPSPFAYAKFKDNNFFTKINTYTTIQW